MKIKLLIFAIAVLGITSCTQHLCPTYQNSAIKYHHHPSHHPSHH